MHDDHPTGHPLHAGAQRVLGFPDRRSGSDRRSGEHSLDPDMPRRRSDRRETPSGHIRNALQVLTAADQLGTGSISQSELEGVRRALWLALLEIERPESRVS